MATESFYGTSNFSSALATPELQASQVDPFKEGLKTGGQALSATSPLATVVPWGTIAAGVITLGAGAWAGITANNRKGRENNKMMNEYARQSRVYEENKDVLSRAMDAQNNAGFYSAMYAKNGGKLPPEIEVMKNFLENLKQKGPCKVEKHRAGGKMNIIPEGTLHARKNEFGDKGIPVVTEDGEGNFQKAAEIEQEEIIFSKELTDRVEAAVVKYKQEPGDTGCLIELGKILKEEILGNTMDKSGNLLKEDDNGK